MLSVDQLRELADRLDIVDVAIRYATALDTKNWLLLNEVFTPNGALAAGPIGEVKGPTAIAAAVARVLEGVTTQHLNANHIVSVTGDSATHNSYLVARHVRPEMSGTNWYVVAGTYSDRLVRTEQGWRIAHRRLDVTWTDGNPDAHPGAAPPG